jgi:hypothetical protein
MEVDISQLGWQDNLQLKWLMMVIDVVLTCGKLCQLECHCQLVLVNFFGLKLRKHF